MTLPTIVVARSEAEMSARGARDGGEHIQRRRRVRRAWRWSTRAWRLPVLRPYIVRLWRWRFEHAVTRRAALPRIVIRRVRRVN